MNIYLLELTTAFRQDNDLFIECFPGLGFEAMLENIRDGFLRPRHFSGEPHLLLHIKQLLYLHLQISLAGLKIQTFLSNFPRTLAENTPIENYCGNCLTIAESNILNCHSAFLKSRGRRFETEKRPCWRESRGRGVGVGIGVGVGVGDSGFERLDDGEVFDFEWFGFIFCCAVHRVW